MKRISVDEVYARAWYLSYLCKGSDKEELRRLTRGKFKGLFLKRTDRRTKEEAKHIKLSKK